MEAIPDKVLDKALAEQALSANEILQLLTAEGAAATALFQAARTARSKYFANKIALYGFIYFSTHCRNDCAFCLYRRSNRGYGRYRKSGAEIVAAAKALAASGVHCLDLTMGEDPYFLDRGSEGLDELTAIVGEVKGQTDLPLMISPGVAPEQALKALHEAGADWYACYQETHNRRLFAALRLGQNYDRRWRLKQYARSIGMLVEEGLLVGVGDEAADALQSLQAMGELAAAQLRAMTFAPQANTPMAGPPAADCRRELNLIAVMRLVFPWTLIPASLDCQGVDGLKARLSAGANCVTSLIPPQSGLQGVSRATADIDEGRRDVASVLPILAEMGLRAATVGEYRDWLTHLRGRQAAAKCKEAA
ncbi:MAG: methylornithine synthase PylB [Desulfobulbaceae bacterium]|nr:methylornithine synthase PylB [Desulfobulbaceae bacterium]